MERDEWLSNVELRGCSAVPCRVHFSQAVRRQHRQELSEIAARYPEIVANTADLADEPDRLDYMHTQGEEATDAWGCVWDNIHEGMVGQVRRNPLDDWSKLAGYQPPSPAETDHVYPIDWDAERRLIRSGRDAGVLIHGATDHGFFFQRLYYLRGFENLMLDIARRDPRLDELCAMVLEFNVGLVERYLELGVDVMNFGDDLGMQERLTISPDDWRRYVKPAYAKLFGMCREAGAHVHLHSDGYIVDIMPDLIECGATILNPQDLCNGLENIWRKLKGKVCIDLDVD
ncbi:MAG: uroporphyrinogen decarboxylase family protein, partial [Planctomycetota bacterium]